jgi:hypothetical protein
MCCDAEENEEKGSHIGAQRFIFQNRLPVGKI